MWRRVRGGKQNHGRTGFKIETRGFLKGAFRIATGSSVVDPRRRDPLPSATSATARGLSEHTPQLLQQASLQHFHRGPLPLILRSTGATGHRCRRGNVTLPAVPFACNRTNLYPTCQRPHESRRTERVPQGTKYRLRRPQPHPAARI